VRRLFSFPNPVNDVAARTVAAGVVALCIAALFFQTPWLLWPLAYGFVARLATGPKLSPWGLVVTRYIVPRLHWQPKLIPGPPKRFAQGIGALLSVGALVAFYTGAPVISWVLIGMITVAASLEAFAGICLGCAIFGRLQAIGVIPASVCEACNNVNLYTGRAAAGKA
jgi:hypothetical protein